MLYNDINYTLHYYNQIVYKIFNCVSDTLHPRSAKKSAFSSVLQPASRTEPVIWLISGQIECLKCITWFAMIQGRHWHVVDFVGHIEGRQIAFRQPHLGMINQIVH